MLDQITPIILTYNEAPNIRRTIEALNWARDVVLVDSFSDDATLTIVAEFPHVRVFQRSFDCHRNQWNFALKETGLTTEWVLAIDADYVLTPGLVEELKTLKPSNGCNGYQTRFIYCVKGKPLHSSAYPPVTVLYRSAHATYKQDGHTQRVVIDGGVGILRSTILHDDRKPLVQWLKAQDRYMRLEVSHLIDSDNTKLGLSDRLRKTRFVFPFVVFIYCLLVRGGIRDGWAGVYYAFQRMLAEIILLLYLIERYFLLEKRPKRNEPRVY